MVVNGQIHPFRVWSGVLREQAHRGDVRGHHLVRCEAFRRLVRAEIGAVVSVSSGLGSRNAALPRDRSPAHRAAAQPTVSPSGRTWVRIRILSKVRSSAAVWGPSACSFLRFAGVRVVPGFILPLHLAQDLQDVGAVLDGVVGDELQLRRVSQLQGPVPAPAAGSRRRISGPSARLSPGPCPEH